MSSGWHKRLVRDSLSNAEEHAFAAYLEHPLLRTACIRASEDTARTRERFERCAALAYPDFRFVVVAPLALTSAAGERFLDTGWARSRFVEPACAALGSKTGALLFPLSSFTTDLLAEHRADPARLADRIAAFFAALPPLAALGLAHAHYVLELDNALLVSRRVISALKAAQVRYCIGLNASMPGIRRQATALEFLDSDNATAGALKRGPLFVRWTQPLMHSARSVRVPGELAAPDIDTRTALAALAVQALRGGAPVYGLIDDGAEGSAVQSLLLLARAICALLEPES